ncbi:MAG: hypothetical protein H6999_10570 [Hahellaceae bacterium]|nr:hypothetical protein [Hahellaceae bacterium]MCP5170184.1 hypothetical protein [Hahellaceae bacterium]
MSSNTESSIGTTTTKRFVAPNLYVSGLGCLFLVLSQVRQMGWLALDSVIEEADQPHSLFHRIEPPLPEPYRDFVLDILRVMLELHNDLESLQTYAESAIYSMKNDEFDESLLRTLWLPLWAFYKDCPPLLACEFGRQAIPVRYKPGYDALQKLLQAYSSSHFEQTQEGQAGLTAAVSAFMASIRAE